MTEYGHIRINLDNFINQSKFISVFTSSKKCDIVSLCSVEETFALTLFIGKTIPVAWVFYVSDFS